MFRTLFLLCLLCAVATPRLQEKIVRGRRSPTGRTPYLVSLMYQLKHYCGGAVVAPRVILTAAHCVVGMKPRFMSIRAGTNTRMRGGYIRRVGGWKRHPKFNKKSISYDVALIYLKRRLPFNNLVQPIKLFQGRLRKFQKGIIAGWGSTRERGGLTNMARIAAVRVTPRNKCRRAYGRDLKRSMYCAGFMNGARDACQGDSGGPLVIGGRLAGIISVGEGCGRRGFPGIYTRVPMLKRWIKRNIR
ncbi:unnamed protein product [Hermetia illucens]|uniref:Peptidase S1 domain-containing protein n=1 Tax=Hermetia illucens TaxID=343691 RepID=A0A7R8UYN0_HERIL|nr:trypsin-1-like [Hermetia illucens]CAD7088916.1 unnamed protein product [Hermetia illucens]